ncbi:WD40 repeat [Macleaya cordata]|uniref:WD40 repeat n=1 Tax=Macleaya cordata TaxID=56857 RepID=A0A200QES9_MACCD|nr:WD40 repeat [Macleaya cordata]
MEDRKLMMMHWDGLGEADEFFESLDRISSAVSINLTADSSESDDDDDDDDEDFDDSRISFASALSGPPEEFRSYAALALAASNSMSREDYGIWMAEPGSIKERRKRLLQGMGLSDDKDFLRLASAEFKKAASKKRLLVISASKNSKKQEFSIVRSRSEEFIESSFLVVKQRNEQFFGNFSTHLLLRSYSAPSSLADRNVRVHTKSIKANRRLNGIGSLSRIGNRFLSFAKSKKGGAFFLIKNLDTGKEFIVNEFNEDGMWNRLRDLQTGKQLTMEEFEKSVGYSPIVKELMRRENVVRVSDVGIPSIDRKVSINASLSKSFRSSKKRGAALLKNIKGVANSFNGIKIVANSFNGFSLSLRENPSLTYQRSTKSSSPAGWTKVRQHGKSCKEFTGLYMCQEIQAHEGSIWTIRFNFDGRYLASAGEDRIIHIWEVVECDSMSLRPLEEANFTPLHPMMSNSPDNGPTLGEAQLFPSERKRRGRVSSSSRKSSFSDYVVMPEMAFSLSERPVCSFQGHLDDVLDLSWSKSQQLLSSSMDKTVRLWDMESKTCLKLFAHNDYVTCIQFNPNDDRYFISGSLDAKVRIWSIPDRKVVDWTDLPEMVTAACYTPDGQGALIGTHKGTCRLYNTSDCKLHQKARIDVQNKKKSHKSQKKITGFQFAPGNPSEVLITSADSRIRIFDGSDVIHKFRGFRNTSSQISASLTPEGKYVVCASEDSQVYIWKRDEIRNIGGGKSKGLITTRSHEHFQCRDVSVAIPWPGSVKYEPPLLVQSKRHSKRSISQPPPYPPMASALEDSFMSSSSIRNLPPLPRKNGITERAATCPEEELANASGSDSGIGGRGSFASISGNSSISSKYGDSPSISVSGNSSLSLSWRWLDALNNSSRNSVHATAWGMVIVTAGLGGEIRAYQNFGLPLRLSRQTNLFRDQT